VHVRARHSCTELYVSVHPMTWHCGTRPSRGFRVEERTRRQNPETTLTIRETTLTADARERRDRTTRRDGGRRARARSRVTRGTARGTHHARVGLSLAFRGVVFPRRRRVGSRRVLDRGRHGDLRWHGRLSGVCEPRRRGPGVSRLESRWNATSREDGAASRERPGESPCGYRAARGDLPARERVKRASTEVEIYSTFKGQTTCGQKKDINIFSFRQII
jgi:hypothetical protein